MVTQVDPGYSSMLLTILPICIRPPGCSSQLLVSGRSIPGLGCLSNCSFIQVHLDTLPQGASPTMDEVFSPLSSGLRRLHLDDQLEVRVVTGMCLENCITPCLLRSGDLYKLSFRWYMFLFAFKQTSSLT